MRALGRSRKRCFRRLLLVDRVFDGAAGDLDAAAAVATYDYLLPVGRGQCLLPGTVERLVAELGSEPPGSLDLVRSHLGEPAALLSREALVAAESETERPTLIIGHTVMGKGAKGPAGESFENKVSTHGQPLTAAGADFAATVKNLGGDAENPFAVFAESREVFAERREALKEWAAKQAAVEKRGARSIRSWRANSTISFRANFPKSTTSPSR